MNEAGGGYVGAGTASEAFKPLGNETRVAVLLAMFEREGGHLRPTRRTFSDLFEATDESTTAGFAYHLRQLVGPYLRKREEGGVYELTYAGLQVGRGLAAGTYTESVDRDPVELNEDCPLCGEADLALRASDNVATVGCEACDRELLALPFPPGGFRSHDADSLPTAFDRHHRHRIGLMAGGNCPECGGAVGATVDVVGDEVGDGPDDEQDEYEESRRALAGLDCLTCGYALSCPVTLAMLSHPAVVSFFHDHDADLRERPIWNVGPEWRELVVSSDPLAVRVSATLCGETLSLYVGRDLTVVHTERVDDDASDAVDTVVRTETMESDREAETERETTADSEVGTGSATA